MKSRTLIKIFLISLFACLMLSAGPQVHAQDTSFDTAVNYAAGTGPNSVVAGDFNADGKLDLAIANNSSGNVSILTGTATGAFNAAVNYPAGTGPTSIVSSDFNADGKLDLAVANSHHRHNHSPDLHLFCLAQAEEEESRTSGTVKEQKANYLFNRYTWGVGWLPMSIS